MPKLPASNRLVFWCPYVHSFIGATVLSKLVGQIGGCKYRWLQNLIRDNAERTYIYCDTDVSSSAINHPDVLTGIADRAARQELCVKEAMTWADLNDLPLSASHFLSEPGQIQPGDIVFCFSSHLLSRSIGEVAPSSDLSAVFSRADIFKIAHLSHYIFNFDVLLENLRKFDFSMLCYESNLAKTTLFQKYAPHITEVVPIPFAVQDRFESKREFSTRDRRCVATGGIDHFALNESSKFIFLEFNANSFNPMRGLLYENKNALSRHLVVNMTRFTDALKETQRFSVDLQSWREALAAPSATLKALRRDPSYYSTSFVDLFNAHQLSYVSEEITGAPALGFFESMACGAVPLGINSFIYNDIGLRPGRNYIPFDGSLGGLLGTVQALWENPQLLEAIVNENHTFIRGYLREEVVASRFVREMSDRYSAWERGGITARSA